jgi:D-glycero-alpha-D-manno-heptose-7-phosphate kinase
MTGKPRGPDLVINSTAPLRICDLGGWTDTWFAHYGRVLNIGVAPCAEVQVEATVDHPQPGVILHVEDYNDHYRLQPGKKWGKHPLLEAAVSMVSLPPDWFIVINLHCAVPPGASMGTSAAVTVALLGALKALTPGRMPAQEVAYAAHRVETELLGQQCGIQDQLCAALGGLNFIEMTAYPQAIITPLSLPSDLLWELERRLSVIYLGKSHQSSHVHEMVIRGLEEAGPDSPALDDLRQMATRGRDALFAGDLAEFGRVMTANHEAQRRLNPGLISPLTERISQVAGENGVLGWKVNGAGGEGGSITLLSDAHVQARRGMLLKVLAKFPECRLIPVRLDGYGLRVWQSRFKE